MTEPKSRVLVIAYHFPPAGGVKTLRAVKLVKYLGEFGWQPYVLAPRGETKHAIDHDSLTEIEERCEITRSLILDPLRPLYALRRWLRRRRPQPNMAPVTLAKPRTWRRKLLDFFLYPDTSIVWLPTALFTGYRLIKRRRIDILLSTSPPFSSHLIARLLAKLTRKPFVVDMRDLWIDNPFVQRSTRVHERYGRYLERKVFRQAGHIVCATPHLREVIEQTYSVPAEKLTVITNGFDPADFVGAVEGREDRFDILHCGSLLYQSGRDPMPLTRGMLLACERDAQFAQTAKLTYLGDMDADNLRPLRALVDKSAWRDRIVYLGSRPHREAVALTRSASLLLFLGGHEIDSRTNVMTKNTETHSIAAKIFEYLASENPILLVAHDCPTVKLTLAAGLGIWCDSYDPEKIADYLLECFRRFHLQGERLAPEQELIKSFSRRDQAGRFAAIFSSLCSR